MSWVILFIQEFQHSDMSYWPIAYGEYEFVSKKYIPGSALRRNTVEFRHR